VSKKSSIYRIFIVFLCVKYRKLPLTQIFILTQTSDLSWVKNGYWGSGNFSVDRLPVSFCIKKVTFEQKKNRVASPPITSMSMEVLASCKKSTSR